MMLSCALKHSLPLENVKMMAELQSTEEDSILSKTLVTYTVPHYTTFFKEGSAVPIISKEAVVTKTSYVELKKDLQITRSNTNDKLNPPIFPSKPSNQVIDQTIPPATGIDDGENLNDSIMTHDELQSTKVNASLSKTPITKTHFMTFFTEGSNFMVSHEEVVEQTMPTTTGISDAKGLNDFKMNESELQSTKVDPTFTLTMPYTYFTTFTYFDILFKEGTFVTESSEETVTNSQHTKQTKLVYKEIATLFTKIDSNVTLLTTLTSATTYNGRIDITKETISNIVPAYEYTKFVLTELPVFPNIRDVTELPIAPSKPTTLAVEQTIPPTSGINDVKDLNDGELQTTIVDPKMTMTTTYTYFTTFFKEGTSKVDSHTEIVINTEHVRLIKEDLQKTSRIPFIYPSKPTSHVTTPPASVITDVEDIDIGQGGYTNLQNSYKASSDETAAILFGL